MPLSFNLIKTGSVTDDGVFCPPNPSQSVLLCRQPNVRGGGGWSNKHLIPKSALHFYIPCLERDGGVSPRCGS
jgi:hypothetical protein